MSSLTNHNTKYTVVLHQNDCTWDDFEITDLIANCKYKHIT